MRKGAGQADKVIRFRIGANPEFGFKANITVAWWRLKQRQIHLALLEEAKKARTEKKRRKMTRAAYRYLIQAKILPSSMMAQLSGAYFYKGPGAWASALWPDNERHSPYVNRQIEKMNDYVARHYKAEWMQ